MACVFTQVKKGVIDRVDMCGKMVCGRFKLQDNVNMNTECPWGPTNPPDMCRKCQRVALQRGIKWGMTSQHLSATHLYGIQ